MKMQKSNDLRQCQDWEKAKYDPGDGKVIVTSKSERLGDETPEKRGHHGTAKGRKDRMSGNGVNHTPAILDRNPAKRVKPWADGPAEASGTHEKPHWTKAVDAGAHPPQIGAYAKGPNVDGLGMSRDGESHDEADLVTKSGDHQHSAPSRGNMGSAGWKTKNYSTDTPGSLPDGELKKKWSK